VEKKVERKAEEQKSRKEKKTMERDKENTVVVSSVQRSGVVVDTNKPANEKAQQASTGGIGGASKTKRKETNTTTEVKTARAEFKDQISRYLHRTVSPRPTYCGGIASELPSLPGLHIENYGVVGLPINELVAEELKKKAKRQRGSNMKKRDEAGVWELPSNKVSFRNPAYEKGETSLDDALILIHLTIESVGLSTIIHKTCTTLGHDSTHVEVKLDKLLLFEPGGQYIAPKSPSNKKAYATLIVQFPSVYTGGELIVQHKEKWMLCKLGAYDGEGFIGNLM